jgi:hypothetical protein
MYKLRQTLTGATARALTTKPASSRVLTALPSGCHISASPEAQSSAKGSRLLHQTATRRNADPTASNKQLLPEFSLKDKVVVVSGGGRGVGLVQAEAVLEAGATGET